MRRIAMAGCLGVAMAVGVFAQQAAAPVAPAATAAFAPDEVLTFNAIQTVGALANTDCQALDSSKRYALLRQQFTQQFETKHAGQTVDWVAGKPVAKVAAAAK